MTNKELHHRFCALGKEHRRLVNELLAMLPEIQRLGVFREYKCESVYEYACKFAGLSYGVVQKALWVEEKLAEAPCLREAVKEVGVHKVALFATIANKENDAALADKVKHMSKPALQELSKELRGNVGKKMSVAMDAEMQFLFLKLKRELGIDDDEAALKIILKNFKNPIPGDEKKAPTKAISAEKIPGRYVTVHQKRVAIAKTKGRCAYSNCNKPYDHLHHTTAYAHNRDHKTLIPLCKNHHEFMHNGLVGFQGGKPEKWKLILNTQTNYYDQLYRKARQSA